MKEEWKQIDDCYAVSNLGRVKSTKTRKGSTAGHIFGLYCDGRGYPFVRIHGRTKKIHQLVSVAFMGIRPDHLQVNHIDGDKTNNRLDNLEYITQAENMAHAARLGLMPRGENNHASKLTEDQVWLILNETGSNYELAAKYNVSSSLISAIQTGTAWKHVYKAWEKAVNDN